METKLQVGDLNDGSYFRWNGTEYMVVLHFKDGESLCMAKGGGMHAFNSYTWVTPTQGETV